MNIRDIIEAIQANRIRITDHADEEATADRLTVEEIWFSVSRGEVIEDYPSDRPLSKLPDLRNDTRRHGSGLL